MLPAGVESKVEQTLKMNWRAPAACSQRSAASESATACAAGVVRDFNATTTASACATSAATSPWGTPITCTVRRPPRTNMLAMSVAPVKSSATIPRATPRVTAMPSCPALPAA